MADLITVSDQDFSQTVLSATTPVLVDFWASWCQPCQMLAPIVDQVAQEFGGALKVAKLDIDANPGMPMKYGVQSIPTLILFKDGREVKRLVGYMPKQKLSDEIKRVIGQAATA